MHSAITRRKVENVTEANSRFVNSEIKSLRATFLISKWQWKDIKLSRYSTFTQWAVVTRMLRND